MKARKRPGSETSKLERTHAVPSARCGKLAYSSKKVAKMYAAAQTRSSGEHIEAYRCIRGCHCWHIGHPPGSREQAA